MTTIISKYGKYTGPVDRDAEAITGNPVYTYQPKGGHRFFHLDAPGFPKKETYNPDITSIYIIRNFTTYMMKGDTVVRKIEWSLEQKYTRGKMPEANFHGDHLPLP